MDAIHDERLLKHLALTPAKTVEYLLSIAKAHANAREVVSDIRERHRAVSPSKRKDEP